MVTKALLAKEIKTPSGLSYTTAVRCIDMLIETITGYLARGETIELRGLGSFGVKTRAARKTSINGQMAVPEHSTVVFRPSEKLRRSVWHYKNRKNHVAP
ncbi:MAG: HU family DNA-binding protein [Treponema sp.]|jgi:nucleoid DNA-binding protein|nr:HU family DNA-binding protein [Treponema sp.]